MFSIQHDLRATLFPAMTDRRARCSSGASLYLQILNLAILNTSIDAMGARVFHESSSGLQRVSTIRQMRSAQ
ncbi:hypothetical protein [Caballeronia sp. LZ032]|uniref:hypothetical protein n=1 Tax=Caballeronia sp. LZ032 TaxID=3038565 RepID=UPI00285EDA3B|nr:hypothetical protein [Caballeronia sp. LZ032]MDR5880034.1 hypothetical protein [Caballeronia sp. LZ032]